MTRRGWAAFAAVSVLWGMPYLFIKVAVEDGVSPAFLSWTRVVIAALLLLGLAWRAGTLGSLRGRWRWLALFAAMEIALPFPLIAAGEQHVSSSLAAILIAAVPLFVALLALRFDADERAGGARLAGLGVGFAGVVTLVGIDVAGRTAELLGALAILVAALGYACGGMLLKHRLMDLEARAAMGAGLGLAGLLLTPAAALGWPREMPSGDAVASIAVLTLFSTALAFLAFRVLIAEAGPARASVIAYVAPVVAVALGVTILDESLGPGAIAGMALILAGSWLATGGRRPARQSQARPGA